MTLVDRHHGEDARARKMLGAPAYLLRSRSFAAEKAGQMIGSRRRTAPNTRIASGMSGKVP